MHYKNKKDFKCPHMIFDELWGEWKCLRLQIRIYGSDICKECTVCKELKKDKKKRKKSEKC